MADTPRRYAIVGAGARAEMFVRAIVADHRERAELVAFADPNRTRMDAHNRWLVEARPHGRSPATGWRTSGRCWTTSRSTP